MISYSKVIPSKIKKCVYENNTLKLISPYDQFNIFSNVFLSQMINTRRKTSLIFCSCNDNRKGIEGYKTVLHFIHIYVTLGGVLTMFCVIYYESTVVRKSMMNYSYNDTAFYGVAFVLRIYKQK